MPASENIECWNWVRWNKTKLSNPPRNFIGIGSTGRKLHHPIEKRIGFANTWVVQQAVKIVPCFPGSPGTSQANGPHNARYYKSQTAKKRAEDCLTTRSTGLKEFRELPTNPWVRQ
jgi:hypothetical protein